MKQLLSAVCLTVLFALPLAAQEKLADRVSAQAACIRTVQHSIDAINQVTDVAFPAQKKALEVTRHQAENFLLQGNCQEAQKTLSAILPLLHQLQEVYLQNQLEDLEHLFLGPSSLEQRAMLREGIALLKSLREKGQTEEAIFVANYLDESFDTPPALSPEQRRYAMYQDALEAIDMWYEWGQETVSKSTAQQTIQTWHEKFIQLINAVRTDTSVSEEEMAVMYENILDKAEAEFNQLLNTNK